MSTGPPVSSTTSVRGLARVTALDKTVLFARQLEAWRVGAFGHPLVDEQDDRVGLEPKPSPPARVDPSSKSTRARGNSRRSPQRRTRVEDHGAVLAERFLRGDSSARNDLRGAAARGPPRSA